MTSTANNQPPDKPNRRSLPARRRAVPAPRRGGRRPGAGGKPGNLNALKHGRRSAQFAHLGLILATIPETRQALLNLAARHRGERSGQGGHSSGRRPATCWSTNSPSTASTSLSQSASAAASKMGDEEVMG